jgi:hypothetical protein
MNNQPRNSSRRDEYRYGWWRGLRMDLLKILILRDMGLSGRYIYPLSLLPVQRERRGDLPVSYDLDSWEFR